MADLFVDPGLNTIQTAINAANNTSGDRVILRNGTYTFNTSQAMLFASAVTGTLFTNLTVMAENPGLAILNLTGVGFDAIYGDNATGVTIKDIVLTGTPSSGGVVRDHADSPMTGWTFQNITLNAMNKTFFDRPTVAPGVGITIKNITTTALYNALYVINVFGPATNLDMVIDGVDARLHVA
ncbi:MAG: hypothetical protein ACREJC_09970, partial [Tepidisphaeraceae bacterium]